jgi:hypothetical protein
LDNAHFQYLVARGPGEVAATWFTGQENDLRWHAARIDFPARGLSKLAETVALDVDAWSGPDRPGDAATRTSAGESIAIAFLRDGSLAAVSPIQDPLEWRYGFTFWRFAPR